MKHLIIRHAKAEGTRLNRAHYGKEGGSLSELGRSEAVALGKKLRNLEIAKNTPTAVSDLVRTQQTAQLAGLTNTVVRPILNEINTANPAFTQSLIDQGIVPPEAIERAREVLADPPQGVHLDYARHGYRWAL